MPAYTFQLSPFEAEENDFVLSQDNLWKHDLRLETTYY